MSIFEEVILRLIRLTCETAIKASSEADKNILWKYTRNLELSAKKRQGVEAFLMTLQPLGKDGSNDLERLSHFQTLLIGCIETISKIIAGTTEVQLSHLSDSLKLTYDKFEQLGLLNCPYSPNNPLTVFYSIVGLYYAKKMLRSKQQPSEHGVVGQQLWDTRPFIAEQEKLVKDFLKECSAAIQSFDRLINHESRQSGDSLNLRAALVLSFVYRLNERHAMLCSRCSLLLQQTENFKFFQQVLETSLEGGKEQLKSLYPFASDLLSPVAAAAPGSPVYAGQVSDESTSAMLAQLLPGVEDVGAGVESGAAAAAAVLLPTIVAAAPANKKEKQRTTQGLRP